VELDALGIRLTPRENLSGSGFIEKKLRVESPAPVRASVNVWIGSLYNENTSAPSLEFMLTKCFMKIFKLKVNML